MRDALAVDQIELSHAEGRRDLVLDNLTLDVVAVRVAALLELIAFANVDADGREELV